MKMDNSKLICVATVVAKDGKADELLQAMHALLEPTRKEPGCLRYELNQSLENSNILTMVEKYTDKEAFDYHCKQAYFKDFHKNATENLSESIIVNLYKEIL
jgi:quinol monooxygenase YgiN